MMAPRRAARSFLIRSNLEENTLKNGMTLRGEVRQAQLEAGIGFELLTDGI